MLHANQTANQTKDALNGQVAGSLRNPRSIYTHAIGSAPRQYANVLINGFVAYLQVNTASDITIVKHQWRWYIGSAILDRTTHVVINACVNHIESECVCVWVESDQQNIQRLSDEIADGFQPMV